MSPRSPFESRPGSGKPPIRTRVLNTVLESNLRRLKVRELAGAIVKTVRDERRGFTLTDGLRAGFTSAEIQRFWDDAMVEARRIEPTIEEMAAQQ